METIIGNRTKIALLAMLLAAAMLTGGCGGTASGGAASGASLKGGLSGNVYLLLTSDSSLSRGGNADDSATSSSRMAALSDPAGSYFPVNDALVSCGDQSAIANASGSFTITEITPGNHDCTVSHVGFKTKNFTASIQPSQISSVNIVANQFLELDVATTTYTITAPNGYSIRVNGIAIINPDAAITATDPVSGNVTYTFTNFPATAEPIATQGTATSTIAISIANDDSTYEIPSITPGNNPATDFSRIIKTLTIAPYDETASSHDIGATLAYVPLCVYIDNTSDNCQRDSVDITWESSDTSTASISQNGVVTNIANGNSIITFTRHLTIAGAPPITNMAQTSHSVGPYIIESTCDDETGTCLDLRGTSISSGSMPSIAAVLANPPPDGISAGRITLKWQTGLALNSVAPSQAIKIYSQYIDNAARTYTAVFTSRTPLATSGETLLEFAFDTVGAPALTQLSLDWDTTTSRTDLVVYHPIPKTFSTLSGSAIIFRDAYIDIISSLIKTVNRTPLRKPL